MRPADSPEVLAAREHLLAKWCEINGIAENIARLARAKESEDAIDALVCHREQLEDEASDLLLDYYCAAERAAGRNPRGESEAA